MEKKYIHRDISWLSFNYRVLQEAKDPAVPLLERVKFLAIYSNNLDEFYRVRVAHLRNLIRVGKKTKRKLEFEPEVVLRKINKIVNSQQEEFSHIFEKKITRELRRHRIRLVRRLDMNEAQKEFVEGYFNDHMLPFVQPVLLVKQKIRPFLNNGALYISVHLQRKEDLKSQYAILKLPSDHLPRFVQLPSNNGYHDIILLDDIVRHSCPWLFPGYNIKDTYSIKLTRDAELYIDDEFSGDLVSKIKYSLAKRNVGPPSRFVYDREMPTKLLEFLKGTFNLEEADLLPEGRYHNNSDFFGFPNFGLSHLTNITLNPLKVRGFDNAETIFDYIKEKDRMLYYPFHSYDYVCDFFEEAAKDPNVTHIKIVQYRVARKSRIMEALINAAKVGKQVTVFVEVKARFDEEANLRWAEKLEKVGVNVLYSFPGLKVHSKIALVVRREGENLKGYSYLSTGNFHEDTARIYCDFGVFTADSRLVREVARCFTFLETVKIPNTPFEHLLVGQFNLRVSLEKLIKREIGHAKKGRKAHLILKMNSLQDPKMIELLYEASQAGVKVDLIIRGICCLIPNQKGLSENINAISIVDRFLEHARVFWFNNNGKEEMYLSSADFMRRNLSYRIEVSFPIYDQDIFDAIKHILILQLQDNVKSRIIDAKHSNTYHQDASDLIIRSQLETYFYLRRLEEQEQKDLEEQLE